MNQLPRALAKDIARLGLEVTESGIAVRRTSLKLHGRFVITERVGKDVTWVDESSNLLPNAMLNHILNVIYGASSKVTTWYANVFKNNYTPQLTDTLSGGFLTAAGEAVPTTDIVESARQALTFGTATTQAIDNTASVSTVTIKAAFTIYGGFIASASAGSTGLLASATKLGTARPASVDAEFDIQYTLDAANDA